MSLDKRGDTIIEVMVVLAVLGLAIGISFATANRSLLQTRGAQENAQATALLQSQIEELRFLSSNAPGSSNYIYQSGLFCVNSSNTIVNAFTGATLSNYGIYPSACVQSFYHLAISYSTINDTFTLTAYYDDAQGQGQDTVTLTYRLHHG
jgi:prepilin-type N-terminal cleavage/methylation domain-containing protein